MPSPMIHFYVAQQITELYPDLVKNLPQFYLGSIAPDAAHFCPDYKPNNKKLTHLFTGDDNWGETKNNDEWLESVLAFLPKYKNTGDYDFALGYVVHIIADICNNIYVWTPFREKYKMDLSVYFKDSYNNPEKVPDTVNIAHEYRENRFAIDYRLAREFKHKNEIFTLLKKAEPVTIPGIVYPDEINAIKENILYKQYVNMDSDTSQNQLFTYEDALKEIKIMVEFVRKHLRDVLT